MTSQQTIIDLTNELDEAHALLTHKESDCTRLARELGASQVREAQEKARLNQELRQTVQNNDHKFSQKLEEVFFLGFFYCFKGSQSFEIQNTNNAFSCVSFKNFQH